MRENETYQYARKFIGIACLVFLAVSLSLVIGLLLGSASRESVDSASAELINGGHGQQLRELAVQMRGITWADKIAIGWSRISFLVYLGMGCCLVEGTKAGIRHVRKLRGR